MAGALRLKLSFQGCLQGVWTFQSIEQCERMELPGPERLERVRCAWQSKQVLGSEAELWRRDHRSSKDGKRTAGKEREGYDGRDRQGGKLEMIFGWGKRIKTTECFCKRDRTESLSVKVREGNLHSVWNELVFTVDTLQFFVIEETGSSCAGGWAPQGFSWVVHVCGRCLCDYNRFLAAPLSLVDDGIFPTHVRETLQTSSPGHTLLGNFKTFLGISLWSKIQLFVPQQ